LEIKYLRVDLKTEIILQTKKILSDRIDTLKLKSGELVADAQNDSKSSAGDKHETARAMMQLEQEKLAVQLSEAGRQLESMASINFSEKHKTISPGALVETNRGTIFLAVALGKIIIGEKEVMVISPQAPLSKAMSGAKENDKVIFNNTEYLIRKIA
jgi:hypothetical protein